MWSIKSDNPNSADDDDGGEDNGGVFFTPFRLFVYSFEFVQWQMLIYLYLSFYSDTSLFESHHL